MSKWIVRCANRKCRHVANEDTWNYLPTAKNPLVKNAHCPKCGNTEFYRATKREIAKAGLTL